MQAKAALNKLQQAVLPESQEGNVSTAHS